jgi:hypothetical protein
MGYNSPDGMGREILDTARMCGEAASLARDQLRDRAADRGGDGPALDSSKSSTQPGPGDEPLRIPVLGKLDPGEMSLPLFTPVIAGLDAFNPCAFFVLLFLLSLMVHARSRFRMPVIGGTFVFFSGFVYFLFMAAWLNLFLAIGAAPVVNLVAGLVAVAIGLMNTKDYFLFRRGPSPSIPDGAKPGLLRRMRGLLQADNMAAMLAGTITLALAANSYELLCTAGFPMVYSRVLTINDLAGLQYYAYLALYNLIYVLPLLVIVILFTATLGAALLLLAWERWKGDHSRANRDRWASVVLFGDGADRARGSGDYHRLRHPKGLERNNLCRLRRHFVRFQGGARGT